LPFALSEKAVDLDFVMPDRAEAVRWLAFLFFAKKNCPRVF